jgi:uncharacterized protein
LSRDSVFADSSYWIALANPRDQWYATAKQVTKDLGPHRLYTTEEVPTEFLNFFSAKGAAMRRMADELVQRISRNPNITVLPQTRDSFRRGLQLYRDREDKEYSLTDCISMEQMRTHNLTRVLTTDHHFEQESFERLLK